MSGDPFQEAFGVALADIAAFRSALRKYGQVSKKATSSAGLTPQRYDLLIMLLHCEVRGLSATVSSISRDLSLGQTAVTELVKRSEAAGLIYKIPSETDARMAHIHLTDDGRSRLMQAATVFASERQNVIQVFAQVIRSSLT